MTVLFGTLFFVACCAVYYWLSSAAGCAADLKGGTWGDPARALELESFSLLPLITALALAVIAPFVCLRNSLLLRASLAVVAFVVVGGGLLLGGISTAFDASHECSVRSSVGIRSNWSAHADTQQQNAAARQLLRAVSLQR